MKYSNLILILILINSCNSSKRVNLSIENNYVKAVEFDIKNWEYKDIFFDTIAGISLNKAYETFPLEKSIDPVIVAVIDSPIDIEHSLIKDNLWINRDEIPNNNLDDDSNGYIDDVHGWNFMGNNNGENQLYYDMEFNRVIKEQKLLIANGQILKIDENAIKLRDSMLKNTRSEREYYTMMYNSYRQSDSVVVKYLNSQKYTNAELENLKNAHPKDTTIQNAVLRISNFKNYIGIDNLERNYHLYNNYMNVLLNEDFNERKITADNPKNINDTDYGNNILNHNVDKLKHGTSVAGSIIKSSKIRIMPVCISGFGNEHDKDIALAIKYAVDNGAKVINMSFGKRLSLRTNWVFEAFKYAEKQNVLIVSSAGNNSYDLSILNDYFPNDNIDNGKEKSNNFLLVGASTYQANENLIATFSNYGSVDVDIFAPGVKIYTTLVGNDYEFENGTSMAASITSKVAALIFSNYPNLTAAEVKQIIMESGVSYNIMVNKPTTNKEKELVPFSSLSKSGKIVNAYNALLMAEQVSKKKKKKRN